MAVLNLRGVLIILGSQNLENEVRSYLRGIFGVKNLIFGEKHQLFPIFRLGCALLASEISCKVTT